MSKTKAENSTIPLGNIIQIYIFYQISMILGDSVLLGGFKIEYEVLDIYGVDTKYIESISDEDLILYEIDEC